VAQAGSSARILFASFPLASMQGGAERVLLTGKHRPASHAFLSLPSFRSRPRTVFTGGFGTPFVQGPQPQTFGFAPPPYYGGPGTSQGPALPQGGGRGRFSGHGRGR